MVLDGRTVGKVREKVLGAQWGEALSSEQQYMNGLGWGGEQGRGKEVEALLV